MTNSKYSAEVRERAVRLCDQDQRSAHQRCDGELSQPIRRVFAENFEV